MAVLNGYITRTDFLNWIATDTATATVDDTVIDSIISAASRLIDSFTRRSFLPFILTHYYDVPRGRILYLEDDLLSPTTLTNGNGVVVSSSDYILLDVNKTPYYGIKLKGSSDIGWESNANCDVEQVISIIGWWGYHNDYANNAWIPQTTLAEDLDISELPWDLTSATGLAAGHILRVEDEMAIISSISTNTATVAKRGANGSTAATHASGKSVYYWLPMDDIKDACTLLAVNLYKKRFGENMSSIATVTPAGVIVTLQDIPGVVREILMPYRKVA